jgi:uncharacterized protein YrrD
MTTSSVRLLRARDVIGMPVVTVDGGEALAEVRDIVFDGANHELVGLTLNKRGWFRGTRSEVLGSTQIAAIGGDAVMVDSADDVTDPAPAADAAALEGGGLDVLGNRVITADGTIVGTVSGVILSAGRRPAAAGYEVTGKDGGALLVPISAQLALSGDNLVVPADMTSFDGGDLAGFGAFLSGSASTADEDPTPGDSAGSDG